MSKNSSTFVLHVVELCTYVPTTFKWQKSFYLVTADVSKIRRWIKLKTSPHLWTSLLESHQIFISGGGSLKASTVKRVWRQERLSVFASLIRCLSAPERQILHCTLADVSHELTSPSTFSSGKLSVNSVAHQRLASLQRCAHKKWSTFPLRLRSAVDDGGHLHIISVKIT